MIRYYNILLYLLFPLSILAQDYDGQRFSERDIQGTARYIGMGGAFTALGGDVSAITDNPAAIGVFRRGEISITADIRLDEVSTGNQNNGQDNRMTLPQLSWLMSFGDNDKQAGVIYNNLIIQYHRLKTYNRHSFFNSNLSSSLTNLIADLTDGVSEEMIQGNDGWHNEEIGWLSKSGYEGYLINPLADNRWEAVHSTNELVPTEIEIYDGGVENEFTAGWGMNYNNDLYFGLTANVRTLNYSRQTAHTELLTLGSYRLFSNMTAQGWGLNAAAGVIYRPTTFLRLGASISTPTVMYIDFQNLTEIESNIGQLPGYSTQVSSPVNSYSQKIYEPMHLTAGIAFQLGYKALLSMEYNLDYKTQNQLYNTHIFKAGAEYAITNNWLIRAGYAFQSTLSQKTRHYYPHYADTRTDTDYQSHKSAHYYSVGGGWRNKSWIIDIAYQLRVSSEKEYAYYKAEPIFLDALTHRIVFTFGWNYRL